MLFSIKSAVLQPHLIDYLTAVRERLDVLAKQIDNPLVGPLLQEEIENKNAAMQYLRACHHVKDVLLTIEEMQRYVIVQ